MNKGLGIVGAAAGFVSAILLTAGLPSVGKVFDAQCVSNNDATTTMTLAMPWQGSEAVEIRVPASVRFKVGTDWRAEATGPEAVLKHLQFSNGKLAFDQPMNLCGVDLKVALSGPAVRQWTLAGSGALALEQLNQANLDINVSGSGSATATGKVGRARATLKGSGDLNLNGLALTDVDLDIHGSGSALASGTAEQAWISISGSGDANLGQLVVKEANVRIKGSGNVDTSPVENADVQIGGSGDVRLLKKPKSMQSRIYGSGRVIGAG